MSGTLLVCLLMAANPGPGKLPGPWPAVRARIDEEIRQHWIARRQQGRAAATTIPGVGWSARMAPPLPQVWPPDGKGTYVVHAFAAGLDPGLHDGEQVSAPWGDWLVAGSALTVKDLGDLRRLGIQGVRPLQGDEREVARTAVAAENAVVALTRQSASPPAPAPLVKRYYCQWSFNNTVIASELQRLHPDFWKWLACGG